MSIEPRRAGRAHHRVPKASETVADHDIVYLIDTPRVSEALQYGKREADQQECGRTARGSLPKDNRCDVPGITQSLPVPLTRPRSRATILVASQCSRICCETKSCPSGDRALMGRVG